MLWRIFFGCKTKQLAMFTREKEGAKIAILRTSSHTRLRVTSKIRVPDGLKPTTLLGGTALKTN